MKQANGAIIYKGPSQIDGKNIVVIVTGLNSKTANAKTGDMLQTWILLDNVSPMEAVKTGQDESICGGCKHRGRLELIAGKWIWIKKSTYFVGRKVRLGAYGDPAAVPVSIWQDLTMFADTTTGYTHQWQDKANAALKYLTMASADSITEYKQAIKAGWRTFRVKKPSDHAMKGETVCPNTTVGLNCADCGACKGLKGSSPLKGNIVIDVHGSGAAAFA